jgi:hypothetical protein
LYFTKELAGIYIRENRLTGLLLETHFRGFDVAIFPETNKHRLQSLDKVQGIPKLKRELMVVAGHEVAGKTSRRNVNLTIG